MEIKEGQSCTLNGDGDLYMDKELREFIAAPCKVVKRTKSGLIQIALTSDTTKMVSVPQKNVLIRVDNPGPQQGHKLDESIRRTAESWARRWGV